MEQGVLRFQSIRPTFYGLEMHLTTMHKQISEFNPTVVVVDPISNLITIGDSEEVKIALMRLVDMLKPRVITSLFTSLLQGGNSRMDMEPAASNSLVSSLIDTWMLLREMESGGETNRILTIIKSRGMAHSNQLREYVLTDRGIELIDVYTGPAGVLTGTARTLQEAREKAESERTEREIERKKREMEQMRANTEARIAELRARMADEHEEMERIIQEHEDRKRTALQNRVRMAHLRMADEEG